MPVSTHPKFRQDIFMPLPFTRLKENTSSPPVLPHNRLRMDMEGSKVKSDTGHRFPFILKHSRHRHTGSRPHFAFFAFSAFRTLHHPAVNPRPEIAVANERLYTLTMSGRA